MAAAEFESGGAFEVNNALGASWFVLPDTEPSAFPDANGQVLIAQLTTTGQVNFLVNLQYRAQNGENPQVLNEALVFPDIALGCTDASACNYDADAEADDGTCTYPADYYDCDGACLNDTDSDGVCDELKFPVAQTPMRTITMPMRQTMTVAVSSKGVRYQRPVTTTPRLIQMTGLVHSRRRSTIATVTAS